MIKQLRLSFVWLLLVSGTVSAATEADVEARVSALLRKMTVAEKIGQMSQLNGAQGKIPDGLRETIKRGRVGSILNEVRPISEAGVFHAWIGGSSDADLQAEFSIINSTKPSPDLIQ